MYFCIIFFILNTPPGQAPISNYYFLRSKLLPLVYENVFNIWAKDLVNNQDLRFSENAL